MGVRRIERGGTPRGVTVALPGRRPGERTREPRMTRTLNIGLIGSGFMGQAHADAFRRAGMLYRDLPTRPHLYMLADATDALAADAAARFGFEKSTGDWRALVNDPAVDVVDITSPNAMHREMALAAIAAGKHVYCEKPLAVTLAEADEMETAARKAGVKPWSPSTTSRPRQRCWRSS